MFKKLFFTFLFLSAVSGLFIALFPLVEIKFPAIANSVNRFTGYYTGPLFYAHESSDNNFFREDSSTIRRSMKNEQVFFFNPADNIKFDFSISYDDHSNSPVRMYLYKAENMSSLLATNLNNPYIQGRQAGAFSQRGEEMPDYANWFSYECTEGIVYALKINPENSSGLNKSFTLSIESSEGWISLPELWGLFVSLMFVLLILTLVFIIIRSVRKK